MPGLSDIAGVGGVAGQLFTWGVLQQLVGAYLTAFVRASEQDINIREPNVPWSPELLAAAVVRGQISVDAANTEALRSGVDSNHLDLLIRTTGNGIPPEQAAEALRRKLIPRDSGNPLQPGFLQAVQQSNLKNEWADTLEALDTRLPGPEAAVTALLRTQRDQGTATDLFKQFGGDPQFFQLLYDIAGEGPSPNEAAAMARRGVIPWTGTGAGVTSFEQAVSESQFRNKWTEAFRVNAEYFPPPRTIQAMYREGSIDETVATDWLQKYGVDPANIHYFLTKSTKGLTQKAHEITEAQLVTYYKEQGISKDQIQQHLKDLGYSQNDSDLIIQVADLESYKQQSDATVAVIKNLFIHGRIDFNTAKTEMDTAHVPANRQDYLLHLWELESKEGTKQLTVPQLTAAVQAGLLTVQDALGRLIAEGYTAADAAILLELKLGGALADLLGAGTIPPVGPNLPPNPPPGTVRLTGQ